MNHYRGIRTSAPTAAARAMERDSAIARAVLLALLFVAAIIASSRVDAQMRDHGGYGEGRAGFGPAPAHSHFDDRFSHNHYYLDRGYAVRGRLPGAYHVRQGGLDYWYDRGQWYRRRGNVSIVIGAPIGAFVPILPLYYSTVWWSGVPYYYADDTYYTWDSAQSEYEVVEPPAGIESGGTTHPPVSDEIFVYPKNGQSQEQQQRDRYECHRSAVDQTGFDPTSAGGGVPPDTATAKRSDYMRAQSACLDARGYSVK